MDSEPENAYQGPFGVDHVGFEAPGRVGIFHYDEWQLAEDAFRLRTLYCGISTGTELSHFQGTNPYLFARWDDVLKLFVEDGGVTQYPLPFTGYMQVGRVAASHLDGVREGDVVSATYGHKTGHTVMARHELFIPSPPISTRCLASMWHRWGRFALTVSSTPMKRRTAQTRRSSDAAYGASAS